MPRLRVSLAAPLLAAIVGCSGSNTTGVALSGRVTYQGKPVREAAIFFTPDIDKSGKEARASSNAGGIRSPPRKGRSPAS